METHSLRFTDELIRLWRSKVIVTCCSSELKHLNLLQGNFFTFGRNVNWDLSTILRATHVHWDSWVNGLGLEGQGHGVSRLPSGRFFTFWPAVTWTVTNRVPTSVRTSMLLEHTQSMSLLNSDHFLSPCLRRTTSQKLFIGTMRTGTSRTAPSAATAWRWFCVATTAAAGRSIVPQLLTLLHMDIRSSVESRSPALRPQVLLRGLSERPRRPRDVRLVEAAGPVDLLPVPAAPSPRRPDAQGGLEHPGPGGLRQQQRHGLRECSTHCDPVYTSEDSILFTISLVSHTINVWITNLHSATMGSFVHDLHSSWFFKNLPLGFNYNSFSLWITQLSFWVHGFACKSSEMSETQFKMKNVFNWSTNPVSSLSTRTSWLFHFSVCILASV